MSKYIDAEKLIAKIKSVRQDWLGNSTGLEVGESAAELGAAECILDSIDDIIDSLQQEQPEVDLEKEIDRVFFQQDCGSDRLYYNEIANIARHFAEWGAIHLNARKEK